MPASPAAFALPTPTQRPSPKAGSRKNNSEKCGIFLAAYLRSFSDHLSPAFHHDFTIKKPQSTTTFSQKPLQKHHSTMSKNKPRTFPRQNHCLDQNPHLSANGIAYSTTGEENELPQPNPGLHHRWRYRCRLRDVSGPSSQLEQRRISQGRIQHEPIKADSKESAFILPFRCFLTVGRVLRDLSN